MTALDIELVVLEVEDLDIPCSYAEEETCSRMAARWIMFLEPCCSGMVQNLACDKCKDDRLSTEDGVECALCGLVTIPARRKYYRVEAI